MTGNARRPGASSRTGPHPSDSGSLRSDGEASPGVADGVDPRSGDSSPGDASPPALVLVDGDAVTLPGLDAPGTGRQVAPLEKAVRQTLAALDEEGALAPVDAGRVALAVELAQIIGDKRASRRTSTVGNDARVLMDILDELAPAAASDADKQLRAHMDGWSTVLVAMERGGHGRAEVRDGS